MHNPVLSKKIITYTLSSLCQNIKTPPEPEEMSDYRSKTLKFCHGVFIIEGLQQLHHWYKG